MPVTHLKSRFCPSPTGFMHLGNARTALFNALLAQGARLQGGTGVFLLRIEDTDKTRSDPKYTKFIQEDLHCLGIQWQEGPYLQSERQDIYNNYYKQLEQAGHAYPCFCTDEELELIRKQQISQNRPPRYKGTCRELTTEQRAEKLAQGIQASLRFCVENNNTIEFIDGIRGPQKFRSNDIGDFIIRRKDGTSPFLFSNALDDALMGVTQVLRGEDHLPNTPRQLLLLKALELPPIQYAHFALITSEAGGKLSKRQGDQSLQEMRQEGFLPIALVNYMARLGHRYEKHPSDLLNFDELAMDFSLQDISKSPAKFDPGQLLYWQKQALADLPVEELLSWMGEDIYSLLPASKTTQITFAELIRKNISFPQQALHWAEILYKNKLEYTSEQIEILRAAGGDFFSNALDLLINILPLISLPPLRGEVAPLWIEGAGGGVGISKEEIVDFPAWCNLIKNNLNITGKALFMPLRIALTGEEHGPELADLFILLGETGLSWAKERLEKARRASL